MKAEDKKLNDIFNGNRRFVVPFFQRQYVWDEPQWERFQRDMENLTTDKRNYFLGSVIFKQQLTATGSVGDVRTIIDGQQRLTTLVIFLKVLCTKTNNNNTFFDTVFRVLVNNNGVFRRESAINHSLLDQQAFELVINNNADVQLPGKSQIIRAYNYFQQGIDPEKVTIADIQQHLQFVVIDLEASENEQLIFDTINTIGLRLTTAELLKNYCFSADDINTYNNIWRPVFEDDDETISYWNDKITKGRMKQNIIETFFYYFLQIKIQDKSIGISSSDIKNQYRRSDNLFENYKSLVEKYGLSKIQLAQEIAKYGAIFKDNFDPNVCSTEIHQSASIERINLLIWEMDCTTLIPYVMQVLVSVDDANERNEIYSILEAYLMRRTIAGSVNKEYYDLFGEQLLGAEYCSAAGLKKYLDARAEGAILQIPSFDKMLEGTYSQKWNNDKARVVLYMMETKKHTSKHTTVLRSFESYQLEHLLPQKWSKNWPLPSDITEEDRNQAVFALGNLSLLTAALNKSISNAVWTDKLNGKNGKFGLIAYAQGFETLKNVLESPEWDESHIEARNKWLATEADKIWKL